MASLRPFALVLSLLPAVVSAQESTPDFRRGQWGLQFSGNFDLLGLGIMRFTGPRSAWLFTLDMAGAVGDTKRVDTVGGTTSGSEHLVFLAVGIGKRVYQAPHNRVRSFQSIGVTAGFNDQKFDLGTTTVKVNAWNAGLLGQLGGAYWVTPSLSIGGTASAGALYTHSVRTDPSGKATDHRFSISGVDAFFAIGLYF